jgi:hypothetical protein
LRAAEEYNSLWFSFYFTVALIDLYFTEIDQLTGPQKLRAVEIVQTKHFGSMLSHISLYFCNLKFNNSRTSYFIVFLCFAMIRSRFLIHNFFFLIFISVVTAPGLAQDKNGLQSFPKDFIGNWTGSLIWHPAGKAVQKVDMQLNIQPEKIKSVYSWQLIYGDAAKDNRPYHLMPFDTAVGHWVIDENEGILLDGYWIGNRFISTFSVQGNTITAVYWLVGKEMHIEMISTKAAAVRESGKGTAEVPKVSSYPVSSYQKAILYKAQ